MSEYLGNKITERCIRRDGIHLNLNIYHSRELQQLHLANQGQPVQVMYDPSDPTFIYVRAKHSPTSNYIYVPHTNLEGLSLHKRWRRQRTGSLKFVPGQVKLPDQHWNIDFMSDILANGQQFRILMVVDHVHQFSPAIEISYSITVQHLVSLLENLKAAHRLPKRITVDKGRDFISTALDDWADRNEVTLEFRESATPADRSVIESFIRRLCQDCLTQHVFHSIEEARTIIEMWRQNYNANHLRA